MRKSILIILVLMLVMLTPVSAAPIDELEALDQDIQNFLDDLAASQMADSRSSAADIQAIAGDGLSQKILLQKPPLKLSLVEQIPNHCSQEILLQRRVYLIHQ